ncbi:MAG TPA: CDP-glycerol glycerophosphotransferase family protein [Thermodesulfobacteriota bacterium]
MKALRGIAKAAIRAATGLLARLVPKDERVLFHGSTLSHYNESARYLYEHFAKKGDSRAVWATGSDEVYRHLVKKGLRVVWHRSLSGYWNYLRAGTVVGTGISYPDFMGAVGPGTTKVCLWHGAGPRSTNSPDGKVFTSGLEIVGRVQGFDYFTMTSRYTSMMIGRLQFLLPESKVVTNGFPRCDHLLDRPEMKRRLGSKELLRRLLPDTGGADRVILYSPTWRQDWGVSFPLKALPGFDLQELDEFLLSRGLHLVISRHPIVNASEDLSRCSRISYLPNDPLLDINQLLPEVSMLMTDYSSIMTDFALLDRPLLFVMPDYEEFFFRRGLLEDFREGLPGKEARSMKELLGMISEGMEEPGRDARLREKFLSRYYDTSITDSCERNYRLINERRRGS